MRRSLTKVSAALLWICTCIQTVYAGSDKLLAEKCTTILYNSVHGKSPEAVLKVSGSLFNYDYAARIAASRHRLNWDTMLPDTKNAYKKKLRVVAVNVVIPKLLAGLTKGIVRRTFREEGLLVIVYASGSRLKVNGGCLVHDGTSAGVSISTLAADAVRPR